MQINYFYEHPHKNNLFGLSQMLSDYRIENGATKIEDKEADIFNIDTPFIAHVGGYFANVYKIDNREVYYIWNGQKINIPTDKFCQSWSGVVLLAETDQHSIEPNYQENKKQELLNQVKWLLLFIAMFTMGAIAYISNHLFVSLGATIGLALNLVGIYISCLLMGKQIHIHSSYADKICSLFKQSDCNNVLESKAAKLLGVISWSEVGLAYFLANSIILLFAPQLTSYSAIINIIALPYSLWSVWYQKVRAKQWCVLCLIVQALLWAVFIVNLIFGFIRLPDFNLLNILFTGCIYIIPLLIINMITPKLGEGGKVEQISHEINSIKANDKVFLALLKAQPQYEVNRSTSNIIFGNPEAPILITVLTNPHCNPCARMHDRIEKILESAKTNLCIQYIFSSFGEELNSSNKFLIATYLSNNPETSRRIYTEWFKQEKSSKEVFWEKYKQDCDDEAVEQEFRRHERWVGQTKIRATPTILINGYELPWSYNIEDIKYFLDLDIDSK